MNAATVHTLADLDAKHGPVPGRAATAPSISATETAVGISTFVDPQPGTPFVVDNLLPIDVALIVAPGGHGKSTLLLQWAISIALGLPIFGLKVVRSGPVVLVSAEDDLRRIRHRLHEMARQMHLTRDQVELLASELHVVDLTTRSARLAELDRNGNIVTTGLTDELIAAYRGLHLGALFLDPLVSFGPGERHVNDGEQATITACRRLVDGLQAPVLAAHHTGKVAAREKVIDLYSGRGGSALGDGARAAYVLEVVENEPVPLGLDPADMIEHRLFRLHQVKLTDARRWTEPLWLVRHGFQFRQVDAQRATPEQARDAQAAKLCDYLRKSRQRFTLSALQAVRSDLGMSRDGLRDLVPWALAAGRLVEVELPDDEKRGRRKSYLSPAK